MDIAIFLNSQDNSNIIEILNLNKTIFFNLTTMFRRYMYICFCQCDSCDYKCCNMRVTMRMLCNLYNTFDFKSYGTKDCTCTLPKCQGDYKESGKLMCLTY